jgi:hypothetical protein
MPRISVRWVLKEFSGNQKLYRFHAGIGYHQRGVYADASKALQGADDSGLHLVLAYNFAADSDNHKQDTYRLV